MTWLALLLLAAASRVPTAPPAARITARSLPTARAAIEELAARRPRVMAFGELHQTTATLTVPSSLKRFTNELLEALAPHASDLVVETWVTEGKCGRTEAAVVKDVKKVTDRPAATEDEILTLLERARRADVKPHILSVSCKEYEAIHQGKGGVDYARLLELTALKLEAGIREVLVRPRGNDAAAAAAARTILVYGGALHNDVRPRAELAPYAFGESIAGSVGGRYLEVDLYVPEYLERQKALRAEPWYRAYARAARPGRATLVERSLDSYVLVFPRAPKAAKPRAKRRR
jgi:hypothetical protein